MTMHLHRAVRADQLADDLGDLLACPLADPFASEIVAVPTRGVERWLSQRLSHRLGNSPGGRDGVCAGVAFPAPRQIVDEAVAQALGADPRQDPWRTERSVWPLLAVIDSSLDQPWCAPLARYLGATAGDPVKHGRRFATAQHLAELFGSYATSRPQMITDWLSGLDVDPTGEPLAVEFAWQPELWRRLRLELNAPSPAERTELAARALVADPQLSSLPDRLSVFGPTRLPPDQLAVLVALAEHREVHLWLPHPSPALWEAMLTRLEATSTDPAPILRRADPTVDVPQHRLLSYLGRDSREFQLSLCRSGATLVHLSTPPATGSETSLLQRLQADIAADRALPPPDQRPILSEGDRSIQIHASHGPDRQVEVLRELLLGLLEADPTLEPRDIVVMCPDIETFAPLISASFGLHTEAGTTDHPGHQLRVRLADRSLRQLNPLLATLSRLLELADARLEVSAVLDLCAQPSVAAKFSLTEDDQTRLRELVVGSGVRWGLDAQHREAFSMGAFQQNTWSAGLSRLLLGVTMSEDGQHYIDTALPLDDVDSSDVDLVGRLAEYLDRLKICLASLNKTQPLREWIAALRTTLDALTSVSLTDSWQLNHAYAELAALTEAADDRGSKADLSLTEIRALLADLLKGRASRANFRTGTLTMCTMLPMRSVPHRVICLLGLDDRVFPRSGSVDGDDILAAAPQVGDRDKRSEDRQLLLDAIMAATENLVIIYSGADPRTNTPRPPAVPLGELIDTLEATVRTEDGTPVRERVMTPHPLQPFDPVNFTAGRLNPAGPFSFDRAGLAGARAALGDRLRPSPLYATDRLPDAGPADPLIELSELIRFYRDPIKALLRSRAGLSAWSEDEDDPDQLPIELDGLQAWAIGERLLRLRLQGVAPAQAIGAEWRRGELPPQHFGVRTLERVAQQVEEVAAVAAPYLVEPTSSRDAVAQLEAYTVAGTLGHLRGDSLVTVHFSRLAPKHRLQAWIELLALTVTDPDRPWRAVTIGRRGCSVIGPVPANFAPLLLTDLVELYRSGLSEPIPLAPKASCEYARLRMQDRPIEPFLKRLEDLWVEDRDAAYQLFYGTTSLKQLLTIKSIPEEERGSTREPSRFGTLARRVWHPLLGSEELR